MKGSKPTQDSQPGGLKIGHLASGRAAWEGTEVPRPFPNSWLHEVASRSSPGICMGRGWACSPHGGSFPLSLESCEPNCVFGTFLFGPGVFRELKVIPVGFGVE